ncbi:MAG: hypothetical protein AB8B55_09485 [Mariniblastus sp.]
MSDARKEEFSDPDIVQRLERSLADWVDDREDYPPAIRGVVGEIGDLKERVQDLVQKVAHDPKTPDLKLQTVLWFDDKNEKLDEACVQAAEAFRPYKVNDDGLISWTDTDNPLLDQPTTHRLIVTDDFAGTNYDRPSDEMILDDSELSISGSPIEVKPNSWKRKITQTLKPWKVRKDDKIVSARAPDDLLLTLNGMFSRTKRGWFVIDLKKLKKQRGSILIFARTLEYQIVNERRFEFLVQLIGTAAEYRRRLANSLSNLACIYIETDTDGEAYITKVSTYLDQVPPSGAKVIDIPIDATMVHADGKPSQLRLCKTGKYVEAKLLPLLQPGKKLATKLDLKRSNSDAKFYRFRLRVQVSRPLLVASSGDAVVFQFNDFLRRFRNTNLDALREASRY